MKTKRILLAQAHQSARDRIKDLLPSTEYEVVEANNGAEAFALFRKRPVDLIILDCDLAFIPGSELAGLVRSQVPHQPILMLGSAPRQSASDLPVDVILHKSCQGKRLVQEIEGLLNPESEDLQPDAWEGQSAPGYGQPIAA